MSQVLEKLNRKSDFFIKKWPLSLAILGVIGLAIRFHYFPYDIPLVLDAQLYFWYANDLTILGQFRPAEFPHIVWPGFLSIFFLLSQSDYFLDYMNIQRTVTIFLSTLTIIPVYFLCKKFFESKFALIGAGIFIFEPRLIQNSLSGIAEPLFILLISTALVLFLNNKKKIVYLSFIVVGLVSLVRPEGIFLFFALSVIFFLKFRKEKKVILEYFFVLTLFILTLTPMGIIREDLGMGDPITGRLALESSFHLDNINNENSNVGDYFVNGIENPIKLIGWALVPVFIFFVPPGLFLIFKKFNEKSLFLTISGFSMLIPIFHAISRGSDIRYIFPIYPIFIIVSLYFIFHLAKKFKKQNLFLLIIITGVLISSLIFLDYKIPDKNLELEKIEISFKINDLTEVVNSYYPNTVYINIPSISKQEFPKLYSDFEDNSPKVVKVFGNSLKEYIKMSKDQGVTHLIIDDRDYSLENTEYLNDIFENEGKYSQFIKKYDSKDDGYSYHVKIFEIDYDDENSNK